MSEQDSDLPASFGHSELRLLEREHHEECRAGAGSGVDENLSAVLRDDLLDDGQTESRSAVPLGCEQRLKHVFENLVWDSGTAVAHEYRGEVPLVRQALAKEGNISGAQGADGDRRSLR